MLLVTPILHECFICLNEESKEQLYRISPTTCHCFFITHDKCFKRWLAIHPSCPICHTNIDYSHIYCNFIFIQLINIPMCYKFIIVFALVSVAVIFLSGGIVMYFLMPKN